MTIFNGHLHADVVLDNSVYQLRIDDGLRCHEIGEGYLISGYDDNGSGLQIWLDKGMSDGPQEYDLKKSEYPGIFIVTRRILSPLVTAELDVKVGGDAQFVGTFEGVDERGRTVSRGSFRLER